MSTLFILGIKCNQIENKGMWLCSAKAQMLNFMGSQVIATLIVISDSTDSLSSFKKKSFSLWIPNFCHVDFNVCVINS